MTLWCAACGTSHRFTTGEVERIVYTLDALVLEERTEENGPDREDAGRDPMVIDAQCMAAILDSSWSPEGYAEWVESPIAQRREADRLARTLRADDRG